jgi:hypothetical protein
MADTTGIENCRVSVTVTGTTAGGVVGTSTSTGIIRDVTRTGTVTGGGGIAGTVTNTNLINIEWSGTLTATATYIGGIVGSYSATDAAPGQPEITSVNGHGSITSSRTGTTYVGGLFGQIYSDTIGSRPKMKDCVFDGKIGDGQIGNGTPFKGGTLRAGGIIGQMGYYLSNGTLTISGYGPEMDNVRARPAAFFVQSTNESRVGGFCGMTLGGVISGCSAEGTINLGGTGGTIYLGGFVSYVSQRDADQTTHITRCYATSALNAEGSVSIYAGGLVGYLSGSTTIANCFTTGKVDIRSTSTSGTTAGGGLIGCSLSSFKAVNCYTTGDVTVIGSTPGVYAGGIIADNIITSTVIDHCFAGGSVSASKTAGTGASEAGGIAGHRNGGIIQNSAAYSGSVSASAPEGISRVAGRIWGGAADTLTSTNNHALAVMRIGMGVVDGAISWTQPSTGTATNWNGATVATLTDRFFWENTLGFTSTLQAADSISGISGMETGKPCWYLNTITGKSHPVLLDANGAVMGDQLLWP